MVWSGCFYEVFVEELRFEWVESGKWGMKQSMGFSQFYIPE